MLHCTNATNVLSKSKNQAVSLSSEVGRHSKAVKSIKMQFQHRLEKVIILSIFYLSSDGFKDIVDFVKQNTVQSVSLNSLL